MYTLLRLPQTLSANQLVSTVNTPTNIAALDDISLTLEENEKRHIERVLKSTNGRVEPAAKKLGLSRNSLYLKIKKYNIEKDILN